MVACPPTRAEPMRIKPAEMVGDERLVLRQSGGDPFNGQMKVGSPHTSCFAKALQHLELSQTRVSFDGFDAEPSKASSHTIGFARSSKRLYQSTSRAGRSSVNLSAQDQVNPHN